MNFSNDDECCFIIIKRPSGNNNCRNFPQEIKFKDDDKFEDNWQDFDNKDCNDFNDQKRHEQSEYWRCNCRRINERKCDHNSNDRPNKRRCGCFNFIRFC